MQPVGCPPSGSSRSTHWNRQESLVGPHCVEVSFPGNLPAQLSSLLLCTQFNKRPQPKLDGFLLGLGARGAKGVLHEFVVNLDVRTHDVYLASFRYTSYHRECLDDIENHGVKASVMGSPKLLVDVSDGLMTLSLNRPDKLNAIDNEMARALLGAIES